MNLYPYEQPIIWHACFLPEKRWWSGRFSHVLLAGLTEETWIHLDMHKIGVGIGAHYRFDDVQDYLSYLLAHYVVVRFGAVEERRSHFGFPLTCVSFVKHTLGVRSRALRPDGLFRTLISDYDGVLLNDPEDQRIRGTEAATPAG